MIPFKTLALFTNLSYFFSEIIGFFKFYIKIAINSMSKFFFKNFIYLGEKPLRKFVPFRISRAPVPLP